MPHPFFDLDHPLVIGHRGSAGTHPENTLPSFAAALDAGAHILETDVHVTRDGVPILLHDPGLERVTEVEGEACDFTWEELRRLDAGHRFEDGAGRFPFRDQDLSIPSLKEAFERFPAARFNLEIKCPGAAAIQATLDLIEEFDRADRTLLAAGENDIMRDLRSALATQRTRPAMGASLAEIVAAVGSALGESAMPDGVMALQIPADFAGQPLVTPELVKHAHEHQVEVHVWTINDPTEFERLLDLGADGIVTDFPGRLADWLARRDE